MEREITNLIDPIELRNEIFPILEKIYKDYSFIELENNFIENFIIDKINKNINRIKDKNSFIKFVKKSFLELMVRETKENLDDDKTFVIVIKNYIDSLGKKIKNVNVAIDFINELSTFFITLNYDLTPEKLTLLIHSNEMINTATKMIVDKYGERYKKVVDTDLAVSIIDIYCMINNISFEDEIDINIDGYANEEFDYDLEEDLNVDGIYSVDLVREIMVKSRQYALLSSSEELELLKKVKAGDSEARNILYERNQRLVISIAKRYINKGLSFIDLFQEGSIGLTKAIDRFDPNSGNKLSTYAIWWIKQAITRAIADNSRNIRLPVYRQEKINRMNAVESRLSITLNREPTLEEIAKSLNTTVEEVVQLKQDSLDTISYNAKVDESENNELEIFLADSGISIHDDLEKKDTIKILEEILDTYLTPRQKEVILLRFGLNGDNPKTLEEVGKIYGVTRERIRQIENKALGILRKPHIIKRLSAYMESPDETLRAFGQNRSGNIYDFFNGYSKNKVDSIILKLNNSEKEIIGKKFSLDNTSWSNYDEEEFDRIIYKIKKGLISAYGRKNNGSIQKEEKLRLTSIYSYYPDFSIEQIDLAIAHLSDEDKKIIHIKYGMDLKNPVQSSEWNIEYTKAFQRVKTLIYKELNNLQETIYSYLYDYPKHVIDNIINNLNSEDKRLLELRYGNDLDNPTPSKDWRIEYEIDLNNLKAKIEDLILEHLNNDKKTIYDCFPDYSTNAIDIAIGKRKTDKSVLIYDELLKIIKDNLSEMEYNILVNRSGIKGKQIKTFKELKQMFKITFNKLKIIEQIAFRKLLNPNVLPLLNGYIKKYFELYNKSIHGEVKTIYSYFKEHSQKDVDRIISLLSYEESELIKLKFGEDLLASTETTKLSKEDSKRFQVLKQKMKKMLNNTSNFYQEFNGFSKEEIINAISKLSIEDKIALEQYYNLGVFSIVDIKVNASYRKLASKVIHVKNRIHGILSGESITQAFDLGQKFYNYFNGYSKEEVDKIIEILNDMDKQILEYKYHLGIIEISDDLTYDAKYLSSRLFAIKTKIKNGLAGKKIRIKNNLVKTEAKKGRTIYDFFPGYDKETIDKIIDLLNESDKQILEYRYHLGIILLSEEVTLNSKYVNNRLNQIRNKIKRGLVGKTLRTKNKLKDKKIITIFDYFPEYDKEDILTAINKLNVGDKTILEYKYQLGIIEIVDEIKMSSKSLSQKLWRIKVKIRCVLEGKEITKPHVKTRNRVYKIKGFYEYFGGYSKEEVNLAFEKLTDTQKELLYLKFGSDLSSTKRNSNWDSKKASSVHNIIVKIKNILEGKIKIHKEKPIKLQKKLTIYDKFLDYSKEEVDACIAILSADEKEILYLRYGRDFENPNIMDDWNSKLHSNKLFLVKKKIKKLMDERRQEVHRELVKKTLEKPKNPTIYEYFEDYNIEEVDRVLKALTYQEKEMLRIREGQDLKKAAIVSDKFSKLFNKMKRNLELNRKQSLSNEMISKDYNNILFEKLLNSLSAKDKKILEMKLGIYGNLYTISEISSNLKISNEEVIDSIRLSLKKYKEILNIYVDNAINLLNDRELELTLKKTKC